MEAETGYFFIHKLTGNVKIVSISLKNFKRHQELSIEANGKNVFLLGPNEAGKSSILDAIWFALNPAKETPGEKIPNPTNIDAEKGEVKIVIGGDNKEYTVTRKFSKGNDDRKITITSPDGFNTNKLEFLSLLFNFQKIEPFSFVEQGQTAEGRRKQLALIESLLSEDLKKELVHIKTSIATEEEKVKNLNSTRTTQRNAIATLGVSPEDTLIYTEEIDVTEETKKLAEASTRAQERTSVQNQIKTNNNAIASLDKSIYDDELEIKRLQQRIEDSKKKKGEYEAATKEEQGWLEQFPAIDTEDINKRIQEASTHNSKCQLVAKYEEAKTKLDKADEDYTAAAEKVNELKQERKNKIAAANLPIPGLTFDDEQIFLNGMPMHDKQLSTSQIMKLSFALALAIGQKNEGKLKLLCIPRGESLDNNSIQALKDFLHENPDYQAFVEEVDRSKDDLVVEYIES